VSGSVRLQLRFKPTFDFARLESRLSLVPGRGVVASAGQQLLTLACPDLTLEINPAGEVVGRFQLRAGQRVWLVLTSSADPAEARRALDPPDCEAALRHTLDYWERWSAHCRYEGPYRDEVLRSALALKLLTYEPTGAIVAAPTTSLPEELGGERNWDYRYTWLRDSSLTLYALMTLGYREEADDFFHWLESISAARHKEIPRVLYSVDGHTDIHERTLDHLDGYAGSRPVRVGNAAVGQRQLDIFGEVLTTAYLYQRDGEPEASAAASRGPDPLTPRRWALLRKMVERAAEHWTEPGHGIWEVRQGVDDFVYGKLMCWAALDRGLRLAEEHSLDAPRSAWHQTRNEIRRAILERGFNEEIGAFTQTFGGDTLDASALAIHRVGFLPPTDWRVQSTMERIRSELSHDGLIYRYRAPDGLSGGEGTFVLCTFWMVDALALSDRLEEAHDLFERVLGHANDLGLLAEEIDPKTGLLLGNFPQGFSHLALIGSAVNLAKAAKHGPERRAETEADRAPRASQAASEGRSARPGFRKPLP
jgi:GH15 family glucan-1,4-alpha-glucosidase